MPLYGRLGKNMDVSTSTMHVFLLIYLASKIFRWEIKSLLQWHIELLVQIGGSASYVTLIDIIVLVSYNVSNFSFRVHMEQRNAFSINLNVTNGNVSSSWKNSDITRI